jgi:hypothetical protein
VEVISLQFLPLFLRRKFPRLHRRALEVVPARLALQLGGGESPLQPASSTVSGERRILRTSRGFPRPRYHADTPDRTHFFTKRIGLDLLSMIDLQLADC